MSNVQYLRRHQLVGKEGGGKGVNFLAGIVAVTQRIGQESARKGPAAVE